MDAAARKEGYILRYFIRYKYTNKISKNAQKEQYKTLSDSDKRIYRKKRRWQRFSTFFVYLIFTPFAAAGVLLFLCVPSPDEWFWKLLVVIAKLLACIFFLIVGVVLVDKLTSGLWKKVDSFRLPDMKKDIPAKACSHLRNCYGLREPYIITKCFDATDKKFKNHDVCIFVVGDELRITADLVHGFLHSNRDLGCYAFKEHEIALTKRLWNERPAAELSAGETSFLLGYRAKGFIEKNFK